MEAATKDDRPREASVGDDDDAPDAASGGDGDARDATTGDGGRDSASDEQGPDASEDSAVVHDAGRPGCETNADCDDEVGCTVDACGSDRICVHDAASCTCAADSRCCDGAANTFDECVGELCSSRLVFYAPDVQPILQAKCATCHTTACSQGNCFATSYSDTTRAATSAGCSSLTVAQCMPTVLATGAMPLMGGCTGDPLTDAANANCLTGRERAIVDAWVAAGSPFMGDAEQPDSHPPPLCARGAVDRVTELFCADEPPVIRGMDDLLAQIPDVNTDRRLAFATSHSTALGGRLVSAINPRIVRGYFRGGNSGFFAALAFARGEQRVELIARDLITGRLNFYLLEFEQACNDALAGCTPGDLYTSAIEKDWLRFTIRDDEDLKNTPLDCRRCHQASTSEPNMLLMREISSWLHWFSNFRTPDLDGDFLLSRGSHVDLIAGVRVGIATHSVFVSEIDGIPIAQSPSTMENWVRYFTSPQPLEGPSSQSLYDAFRNGDSVAPPYPEVRVTDPIKLRQMSAQYLAYLDGDLPRSELPDLAGVFLDVPRERALIGLAVEIEATAPELLLQGCAPCHNDRLDQSLSRARFDAKSLTPDHIEMQSSPENEIRAAIDRLSLPPGAPGRMPPAEARVLDDAARHRLLEYLRNALTPSVDPVEPPDTVPEILAAHGVWLESDGREGARADLDGANLEGFDLQGFDLTRANLVGTNLRGADLRGANLTYAYLEGANLNTAYLEGANLEGADLYRAQLEYANLEGANLSNARLRAARLSGANLTDANLTSAKLNSAIMYNADLGYADLRYAELSYVELAGADLSDASLISAYVQGARFQGASLHRTNLTDADFTGAILSTALGLTQAQLDAACGSAHTTLPNGLTISSCI